jgi:hypothetical protein
MVEALSVVVGLLSVAFGYMIRLLWVAIEHESERLEDKILRDLETALQETGETISKQLDEMAGPLQEMPGPMETIELMRANLVNTLMELGVGWVGKKFGMDMGVHSFEEPPRADELIEGPLPDGVHGPT